MTQAQTDLITGIVVIIGAVVAWVVASLKGLIEAKVAQIASDKVRLEVLHTLGSATQAILAAKDDVIATLTPELRAALADGKLSPQEYDQIKATIIQGAKKAIWSLGQTGAIELKHLTDEWIEHMAAGVLGDQVSPLNKVSDLANPPSSPSSTSGT